MKDTYIKAGSIENGVIERGAYGQEFVYKDEEAFLYGPPWQICYIPELSDKTYSRMDFINLTKSDFSLAIDIFYSINWQHPETYYDELMREE